MTAFTPILSSGYADTIGTRGQWRNAETVMVGEDECKAAKFVGMSDEPFGGSPRAAVFKLGRRLYAQIRHPSAIAFDAMSEDELMSFWGHWHRPSRASAEWLVGKFPGYVGAVETLANYASNLACVKECKARGDEQGATIYEHACKLNLSRMPEHIRALVR